MTNVTHAQEISYTKNEVLKAGEVYKGGNGATVIVKKFYEDSEGGLMVAYSAMHPEMHDGKWMAGDITPNFMYRWVFPNGKYA